MIDPAQQWKMVIDAVNYEECRVAFIRLCYFGRADEDVWVE